MVIDFRKKDSDIMPLKINDQIIDQVCTYTYLEVTIDEKLHWSDHINNIQSKANKRLYFVSKLGQFKVDRILITLCLFVLLVGEGTVRRETVSK